MVTKNCRTYFNWSWCSDSPYVNLALLVGWILRSQRLLQTWLHKEMVFGTVFQGAAWKRYSYTAPPNSELCHLQRKRSWQE